MAPEPGKASRTPKMGSDPKNANRFNHMLGLPPLSIETFDNLAQYMMEDDQAMNQNDPKMTLKCNQLDFKL